MVAEADAAHHVFHGAAAWCSAFARSVCDSVESCTVEEDVNPMVVVAKDTLQQLEYRALEEGAQHQFSRTRHEGTDQPFV